MNEKRVQEDKENRSKQKNLKHKKNYDSKIKRIVEQYYHWVSNILKKTKPKISELILSDSPDHKIVLQYVNTDGLGEFHTTNEFFNEVVIKKLVKEFKSRKNHTAHYYSSDTSGIYDKAIFKIK